MQRTGWWTWITAAEIALAITAVVLDLFIPTLVILALMAVSLLIRRQRLSSVGFQRTDKPWDMLAFVTAAVVLWSLLQIGLIMPVVNRLTGSEQDVSAFADLQGNTGKLLFLLLMTWTLAALGEEIVYRGYLQQRLLEAARGESFGPVLAVGVTSILFGLAHSEQGLVGVIITALDAVFFSLLKLRFCGNLWAAVLAHGLSNTIGLITYFLVGPITALW